MTTLLCYIFVLHFIADFLCQPRWMAMGKSEKPAILLLHTLVIMAVMLIGLTPFLGPMEAMAFCFCNALAHGITDMFSWKGYKWYVQRKYEGEKEDLLADLGISSIHEYPYWEDHWFYTTIGFDQLLHGLALIILAGVLL